MYTRVCVYMCDCDLCNTNYGIGQLLSICPIILLSGIVAVFTQQHFFSGFIGCCCFLCTKEKCQTSAVSPGNGCSHWCSYAVANTVNYFPCKSAIQNIKQDFKMLNMNSISSNTLKFLWHIDCKFCLPVIKVSQQEPHTRFL